MKDSVLKWNPNFDEGLFEDGVKETMALLDLLAIVEPSDLEEMTVSRIANIARKIVSEKIELNVVKDGIC